jgi:ABC-type xylose transport system permease subunit
MYFLVAKLLPDFEVSALVDECSLITMPSVDMLVNCVVADVDLSIGEPPI